MTEIEVRHSCDRDIDQIQQIYAEPSNVWATLQLPFPSLLIPGRNGSRLCRKEAFSLVACRSLTK